MDSLSAKINLDPRPGTNVLLHSCCAPCSGGILTMLHAAGVSVTVFFYNPNIHPEEEYKKRKGEIIRFAQTLSVGFVDADYEPAIWQTRVKGLEEEPERGKRCEQCFDLRLERSALFAHENSFNVYATTLGASRWKDLTQVNAAGAKAAGRWPGLSFWAKNWREEGGAQLMEEVARQENFYRQKYCGCRYSIKTEQITLEKIA